MVKMNIKTHEPQVFADREQAAKVLALELEGYRHKPDVVVVGNRRGGVIVAEHIANQLRTRLDVSLARKITAPEHADYTVAAVTETGKVILQRDKIAALQIPTHYLEHEKARQTTRMETLKQQYRRVLKKAPLAGRTVILTDDGAITGATMEATIVACRAEGPRYVVLALPVVPLSTLESLSHGVDEVVCLCAPPSGQATGQFFTWFRSVSDEVVIDILGSHSCSAG